MSTIVLKKNNKLNPPHADRQEVYLYSKNVKNFTFHFVIRTNNTANPQYKTLSNFWSLTQNNIRVILHKHIILQK